jgi:hypothetical protein
MAVYLVQHGKSLAKSEDPEKGLSAEGKKETERIAEVASGYRIKRVPNPSQREKAGPGNGRNPGSKRLSPANGWKSWCEGHESPG